MPLANPTSEPIRKPPLFNRAQTIAIAEYVASLGSGGPGIPTVDLKNASVGEGFSIFALELRALSHSDRCRGRPLERADRAGTARSHQGPGRRGGQDRAGEHAALRRRNGLERSQVTDVIAYVTRDIEHSDNPGGLGLGGVGPVAEGFIGLFVGVGACVLVGFWVGDRTDVMPTRATAATVTAATTTATVTVATMAATASTRRKRGDRPCLTPP